MAKYLIKQTVKVGGRIVKPAPEGVELSEKEAKAAADYILGKAEGTANSGKGSKASGGKGNGGKSAGTSSAAGKGDDPESKGSGESSGKKGGDGKVNVNTASAKDLAAVSGIGDEIAKAIVEHRAKTPFEKLEDLVAISGLAEAKVKKLADRLTV